MRRLYRRICELRAAGRAGEAAALEDAELPGALVAARSEDATVNASTLHATEEERVSAARLLAELIAPLLVAQLPVFAPLSSRPGPSIQPAAARRAVATAPEVADLIDDMLAQAARRPAQN